MSAPLLEALEMENEVQKSAERQANEMDGNDTTGAGDEGKEPVSELGVPGWSIVTFEGVAVSGLSYAEALAWMQKLTEQKLSGLCIITDEAAARISK